MLAVPSSQGMVAQEGMGVGSGPLQEGMEDLDQAMVTLAMEALLVALAAEGADTPQETQVAEVEEEVTGDPGQEDQ